MRFMALFRWGKGENGVVAWAGDSCQGDALGS